MELTFLPNNKVSVTTRDIKGNKRTDIKMLGELSLELINFDFEPICKKAFELSKRLAALDPSKRLTSSALKYAKEVKDFVSDYAALTNEVASTPLSNFVPIHNAKSYLVDLYVELKDAECYDTLEELLKDYHYDRVDEILDEEFFSSIKSMLLGSWERNHKSLLLFQELFEILVYLKDKNLVERIQDYGLDKLNNQIKKAGTTDINYSITQHEGKLIFVESYFANLSKLLTLEFVKMLQADISIKHCQNCGKLFALYSGHKNNYCSSIPLGETQSCSVIGPIKQFKKKTQSDPLLKMFDKIKKRVHARGTRNDTGYKFEDWSRLASAIRDDAIATNLSPEELEKRLEAASDKVGI